MEVVDLLISLTIMFFLFSLTKTHCKLLDVIEFPEAHSPANILEKRDQPLDIHGITVKAHEMFITSDSGSNLVIGRDDAYFNGITCMCHNLHLTIERTKCRSPEVQQAFESGSKTVSYNKRGGVAKHHLEQQIKEIPQLPKLRLIQRVSTRWNSYLHQDE